jgi:hypothetical protein
MEKEDIIFSREVFMATNSNTAFFLALAFLLPIGRPVVAAAASTVPSSPTSSLLRVKRTAPYFLLLPILKLLEAMHEKEMPPLSLLYISRASKN